MIRKVFMEQTLHIKNLKIKKGELILRLSRPEKAIQLQASIVFQNTGFHFSHPVELSIDDSSEMVLKIDVSFLEQNDGDWTLVFQDTTSDTVYTAILDSKVRLALLLGRHYVRRGDFVYFPMGGSGHSFLLRCRHWQPHDRLRFRIKELSAFAIYKIFGKLLRKRHIWLIYEKFCVTAQENGFYFFEYCMKQNEKNVYFILDRKSPQWNDMQKYSQNVIPFLSFRHILYLLTADLYISPDGRHHAYIWKPMPNPVTREINKQKLYFLQHGVLYLKNVDNLFGVHSSSPVTYFTASSEFEKNIITQHMEYEPSQVPVTGLARWDKLENTADPAHPFILLMPTWRSWLEGQNDELFCQSSYYRHYTSLLNDQELLDYLKEKQIRLVFYIHPKLREFIGNFHADNDLIELISFNSVPLNQLLMGCSMMITDYSSACWDAYYLEKPILFYQFDLKQYNETNGSYVNMEKDLFGDRCTKQNELVRLIREYTENGFQEKPAYAAMRNNLFVARDHDNCKRTYEYIKSQGY